MRKQIFVIVVLISVINSANAPVTGFNNTTQQNQKLEVHLIAEKRVYKRGNKIDLKAIVINTSDQDVFVYGNLEWGYSAS